MAGTLRALRAEMRQSEYKFRKICQQLVLLDNEMTACKVRYRRAQKQSPAFRSSLRLRVVTLENVRHVFWQYMEAVADGLDEMEQRYMQEFGPFY